MDLKAATGEDLELLFAWRLLLCFTPFSTEGSPPTWDHHKRWFYESVSPYLIWSHGHRVGVVSYDSKHWVSIHIAEPGLRGKGIAGSACRQLLVKLKEIGCTECYAKVHTKNAESIALFASLGFLVSDVAQEWYTWRKDLVND